MANTQTLKVGTAWEIDTDDQVEILRPDGSTVRVSSRDGVASHVLDVAGVYRCGDLQITAK